MRSRSRRSSSASRASEIAPARRKPSLFLMGQRGSGKTSICSVVFEKLAVAETLFLESTQRMQKAAVDPLLSFEVWDLPGQLNFLDPSSDIFCELRTTASTLIWVIDCLSDYHHSLSVLHSTIIHLRSTNPLINIEVFLHKAESLSHEYQHEIKADIVQHTTDEMFDNDLDDARISFYLTSIHDYSIHEALSSVIQKVIPHVDIFGKLLDAVVTASGGLKAFLFSASSKIYVATDSSPVDLNVFEYCCDFINFSDDLCDMYGSTRKAVSEGMNPCENSTAMAKMAPGAVLYSRNINKYLKVVCLMRGDSFEAQPLVEYNMEVFRCALENVFDAGE